MRLYDRLGVEDEDTDVDAILDAFYCNEKIVAREMFRHGVTLDDQCRK